MKKKGPKSIPDFSSKRKDRASPSPETTQDNTTKAHAPVTTKNVVKPATSSKGGRRGG